MNIIDTKKIELDPVKDAYVCDCKPDETNPNGNEKVLYQGQYKDCFDCTLIEWDISRIDDNIKIIRAEVHFYHLKLYLYGKKNVGKLVYYPIIEPWSDVDVSINRLPGFDSKLKVISKWPTKEGWHIIDITEIAKEWYDGSIPNYGLNCHSKDTESTCVSKFISSEGVPKKLRPKLVIEYK